MESLGLGKSMRGSIAVFLLLVFGITGCKSIPPEYDKFLEMPPERQHEAMRALPIDKQIDYYLAARTYSEPPVTGLEDDIARQGKSAIPALTRRLKEEKDELRQYDLINVLETMHIFYYNLGGEPEVIAQIHDVTAKMRSPTIKKISEDALKTIQENKAPNPVDLLENRP